MIKVAISVNKCDSGGQKSLIMAYARNFDPSRIKFDLIVDEDSNSIPFDEVRGLGGHVHIIPPYQRIVSHMRTLYRLFKKEKYDVLYAANNTMNLFPLCVAYYCGIKVRVSESLTMASPLERKKTMLKNILRHFSHFYCNYFMSNGRECGIYQFGKKAMEGNMVSIFLTPVDAKDNDFDQQLRDATRKSFGWTNKVVYGFIARFELQKNPLFVIDIMNEIRNRSDNAHFVIIGIGSMEQQMKEQIKAYALEECVSWLGRREDIKQFYNAFDAFLLPSLYEGLPVVGIESQASGLPVFFSDNVTREASVGELGHFISLQRSASEWANIIIVETQRAIPLRKGRADELRKAGFDAVTETLRLTKFFEEALKEQTK